MKSSDIKLVKQPKNSNVCGQACVAMILGIPLKLSILLFESSGKTSWKHLRKILRVNGVHTSNRMRRITTLDIPEVCMVKIWWGKTYKQGTHWIVRVGDRYFDPAHPKAGNWWGVNMRKTGGPRVTSYAEIKLTDE